MVYDCSFNESGMLKRNGSAEKPILDSGEMTEYETGAVRESKSGKGRMDLIPIDVLNELMQLFIGDEYVKEPLWWIERFLTDRNPDVLMHAVKAFSDIHPDWEPIFELSKHFEKGADDHGLWNWAKGLPATSYLSSALRHYVKWWLKQEDEPHDTAFAWNIVCLWWTLRHKPELDDLHYYRDDYGVSS